MNNLDFDKFENAIHRTLKEYVLETPIEELRKLDWFSLNPDFYIEQDKHKKAA